MPCRRARAPFTCPEGWVACLFPAESGRTSSRQPRDPREVEPPPPPSLQITSPVTILLALTGLRLLHSPLPAAHCMPRTMQRSNSMSNLAGAPGIWQQWRAVHRNGGGGAGEEAEEERVGGRDFFCTLAILECASGCSSTHDKAAEAAPGRGAAGVEHHATRGGGGATGPSPEGWRQSPHG